jgi:hypothetical protein
MTDDMRGRSVIQQFLRKMRRADRDCPKVVSNRHARLDLISWLLQQLQQWTHYTP